MIDYLFILIGFSVLIVGAHFLVEGASGMAKRFNVSNLIIGLTVVAFGTSAPELVVNLVAALNPDTTDLALTNIIGSNMINTFVILGVAALIFPIVSQKSSRHFDIPLSLFAPIAIMLLAFTLDGAITQIGGVLLLMVFGWFIFSNIRKAIKHPEISDGEDFKPMKIWLAALMMLGGLGALIGGAQLIVPAATNIAVSWGVSQSIIGLTIVALGTSLPELATSAVAAFKRNSDIALGNVIGSNIFNVFFVLSTSAIISPLPAYNNMYIDLIVTALGSLLIILMIYSNKLRQINRWGGALLLVAYILYIIWMIWNTNTVS